MSDVFLKQIINKYTIGKNRYDTEIKGLSFHRAEAPTEPVSYMFSPHFCLIVQGAKHIILGNEDYIYDEDNFVVSSVDLPLISKIIEASKEKPYLCLSLEIDLEEIYQITLESNLTIKEAPNDNKYKCKGIALSNVSEPLVDAVKRLVNLLNNPSEINVLAPVIKKEIYYRLLTDKQGYKLKQIISRGSQKNKILKAINFIKDNFNNSLNVKELADFAGMSESTFYYHFKLLTSMSPLQYQKKIRLNEAKKLMLVDNLNAGNAAFLVGYESLTQFNREYKRMFGNPPKRDIKGFKEVVG